MTLQRNLNKKGYANVMLSPYGKWLIYNDLSLCAHKTTYRE